MHQHNSQFIIDVLQVAMKRIGDVLNSPENAKRVLREVCILRRLRHPHIISLKDAFARPSETGRGQIQGKRAISFLKLDLMIDDVSEYHCDSCIAASLWFFWCLDA